MSAVGTPVVRPAFAALTADPLREAAAGRAAGYAAGWSAGAQAARACVQAELASIREQALHEAQQNSLRATTALQALERAATQVRLDGADAAEAAGDQLLEIALQLAAAVLGHEPVAAQAPARDALRRALVGVPAAQDAVVRLHPRDAAALAADDVPPGVVVVADVSLAPGDSVLESGAGRVEVLLQAGLQRAREVLLP